MQYRNKIIALFMAVCLLVTSLCVPVSAAGEPATMLYNGVELPALPTNDYGYALFYCANPSDGTVFLYMSSSDSSAPVRAQVEASIIFPAPYTRYILVDDGWMPSSVGDDPIGLQFKYMNDPIWSSFDIDGFIDGSEPIYPNAPVGTMTYYTTNFGSDYSHTTFGVGGLSENDTYFIRGCCYQDSSLIATVDSPSWTGSDTYCTVEFSGLTPSTTYDFEYVLYVNDTETSVTYTNSVTTLDASSGGDDSGGGGGTGDGGGASGGCTECPSILSTILSAITNQSTFLSNWKQDWSTRMDSLESTFSKIIPVPDPTETALKESVKDTTQAVVDEVFADDSPTKVTASDVKDVAQIGSAASSMFDSGVSIGSFFDALNNIRFIAFFSQETYDDLNTVQSISTYSRDNESGYVDYYSENLDKIQKFVGGE